MNFRTEKVSPFVSKQPTTSPRPASPSGENRTARNPLAQSLRGYATPGVFTRDNPHTSLSGALPGRVSPPPPPPQRALQERIGPTPSTSQVQERAEPEMPLQLSKIRGGGKGLKRDSSIKSSSQASLASIASSQGGKGEGNGCVYLVRKAKDLPKLHRAVWKEDINKLKAVTNGIRTSVLNSHDKWKRTALHLACAKGLEEIVVHLCATCKADTNVLDGDGATPMHRIIECGQSSPLKHLLDYGGNPNLSDKNGRTPLHVAARLGDSWAASLLLERDARIDGIDKDGRTALHMATVNGHQKLVSKFIEDGADINCQDGEGKSCLMLSCMEGSVGIVKLLCDSKANPHLFDRTSFKAVDYAITRNHHDCAHIVEQYQTSSQTKLLFQIQTSQTGSLVDHTLIHTSYGVGRAGGAGLDGCPAVGHVNSPAYSEETASSREGSPGWGNSDTEEIVEVKFAVSAKLPPVLAPPSGPSHMADVEEEPAVLTTNEVLSDQASHDSAHTSREPTPPAASPAHPHREDEKEEAKVESSKKEVTWSSVLSEADDGAILTDFDSDISGLLSDGEYMPSTDKDRKSEGHTPPIALGRLSPVGVAKDKGVATSSDLLKGKGKWSPSRQSGLAHQGGAGGVVSPVVKTDPVVPKGKGKLSPRGLVSQTTEVVKKINYSDFDSETDSGGESGHTHSGHAHQSASPSPTLSGGCGASPSPSPTHSGSCPATPTAGVQLKAALTVAVGSPEVKRSVMEMSLSTSGSSDEEVDVTSLPLPTWTTGHTPNMAATGSVARPEVIVEARTEEVDGGLERPHPQQLTPPSSPTPPQQDLSPPSPVHHKPPAAKMTPPSSSQHSPTSPRLTPPSTKHSHASPRLTPPSTKHSPTSAGASPTVAHLDMSLKVEGVGSTVSASITSSGGQGIEGVATEDQVESEGTSTPIEQPATPTSATPTSELPVMNQAVLTDTDTEDVSQMSETTGSRVTVTTHDSKLDGFRWKTEHLGVQRSKLEQQLLQLELENRELRYALEQAKESVRSKETERTQLRERLDRMESRLGEEVEGRQVSELKVRELEVKMRTVKLSEQKQQEEIGSLRIRLQAESEARLLQEGIYKEQVRVFQSLQTESERAQGHQSETHDKLVGVDKARLKAEDKLREVSADNSRLKLDLAALKQRGEEAENQLESELDTVKAQLHEMKERCLSAEASLLDSQQLFKTNLKELQEKANMLSTALEREVEAKSDVVDELAKVRCELERVQQDHLDMQVSSSTKEGKLSQQLAEAMQSNAVLTSDLKNTRDSLQQQNTRLESLKAKLHLAETSAKSFETLSVERAHQISSLERDCQVKEDRLGNMDETVRKGEERMRDMEGKMTATAEKLSVLQVEKERLTQQVEYGRRKMEESGSTMAQAQSRFDGLLESVRGDQHKIGVLEETLAGVQGEKKMLVERLSKLEGELSQQREAHKKFSEEREGLLEAKVMLKGEVASLESQLNTQRAELEAGLTREQELAKELQHIVEVRSTLEGLVSGKQEEIVALQQELGQVRVARDKAAREAQETRGLWEAEVKTKSRLGQELVNMQRTVTESRTESHGQVAVERRKTRKALELKKQVESRVQSAQLQCSQLQEEVSSLKAQLKASRHQAKQVGVRERELADLRAQHQEEKASMQLELEEVRGLLDDTTQQLKREGEARLRDFTKVKRDLEMSHSQLNQEQMEIATQHRERSKLDRENRKLREELQTLQEQLSEHTIPKVQVEVYKKEIEDKARRELTKKLEEVNAHMDQQSQAQEALLRLRSNTESEWRSKYEHACEEIRELRGQLMADRDSTSVENSRLKELFEGEVRRSEKLASRLQRSKDEAVQCRAKLNLEHNRTQQLLNSTQVAAASLAPPSPPPPVSSLLTSTPRDLHHLPERSSEDDLLSSVRMQLDNSIARHLERATTTVPSRSIGKATRSTYSESKYNSPLDSICSNYHI